MTTQENRFKKWLRRVAWLLVALFLLGTGEAVAGGKPTLFVFVPSDQKVRSVEKALQGSMSALDVTVFGRARDFEKAVQQQNPSAVMALPPMLKAIGASPNLKGTRGGSNKEPYVLVTVDSAVSPSSLSGETIGAFGILGRSGMKSLYGKILGTGSQKVKTVTKYEDLLPLLQFKAAKGVVLPARLSSMLTGRSKLNLVVSKIPNGAVGVAAVGIREGGASGAVTSAVKGMDGTSKKYLGVDGWQ